MSTKKINAPVSPDDAFVQMGEQLTSQYKRAVSGMVEVVKFGAMLMQVKETLIVQDGPLKALGQGQQGGLAEWLRTYAPKIKKPTGYRFMAIAEAVQAEYAEIVGVRVAKKYTLPELVSAQELPKAAQAKQLELFDYISGTSQRSWLDRFDPPAAPVKRGGTREGAGRPPTDLEAQALLAVQDWEACHAELIRLMGDRSWIHLTKEQLTVLDGTLLDLRREIKEAL